MLTYTSSPPSEQILPPVSFRQTSHTTLYDPPIDEFSVLLTVLKQDQTEKFSAIDGPSILIFTELKGGAKLRFGKEEKEVQREGQVFFVGAGQEIGIESKGERVVAYRAFVEAGN